MFIHFKRNFYINCFILRFIVKSFVIMLSNGKHMMRLHFCSLRRTSHVARRRKEAEAGILKYQRAPCADSQLLLTSEPLASLLLNTRTMLNHE